MEKTFFLFGVDPCDAYIVSGNLDIIAYLISRNNGALFTYDSSCEHPNILLSNYDGWGEWVEIKKEEYEYIKSKL